MMENRPKGSSDLRGIFYLFHSNEQNKNHMEQIHKYLQLSVWIISIKILYVLYAYTLRVLSECLSDPPTHNLSENSSTHNHLPELYSCQHVRTSPQGAVEEGCLWCCLPLVSQGAVKEMTFINACTFTGTQSILYYGTEREA